MLNISKEYQEERLESKVEYKLKSEKWKKEGDQEKDSRRYLEVRK